LTVDEQVFVFGLQLFVPHAVSLAAVHWTQVPAEHAFFPLIWPQSASAEHGPQVFVVALQSEAVAVVQSAFDRQATQDFVAVLHWGLVASLQSALERQLTQLFVPMSQTAFVESLQSLLVTHSTQLFVPVLHTGVVPLHAPLHGEDEPPAAPPFDKPPFPPLPVPPVAEEPAAESQPGSIA
jgi:hypothetical protein